MSGIIVGIDGSEHSRRTLEWAVREAATRQVPLNVITVFQTIHNIYGGPANYAADHPLEARARQDAEQLTEKVLADAGDKRPGEVSVRVVVGQPAAELIEASRGADLIVVGARGGGGFGSLRLGSVTTQVAHHAHCPIVIVPPEERG